MLRSPAAINASSCEDDAQGSAETLTGAAPCAGAGRSALDPGPPPPRRRRARRSPSASCQYPSAMLEDEVSGASYARLGRAATRRSAAPAAVPAARRRPDLRRRHGRTLRPDVAVRPLRPPVRDPLPDEVRCATCCGAFPSFMMLDDHEIVDNWEPRVDDTRPDPAMIDGRQLVHEVPTPRRTGAAAGPGRRFAPSALVSVSRQRLPVVHGRHAYRAHVRGRRVTIGSARIMSDGADAKRCSTGCAQQPARRAEDRSPRRRSCCRVMRARCSGARR